MLTGRRDINIDPDAFRTSPGTSPMDPTTPAVEEPLLRPGDDGEKVRVVRKLGGESPPHPLTETRLVRVFASPLSPVLRAKVERTLLRLRGGLEEGPPAVAPD